MNTPKEQVIVSLTSFPAAIPYAVQAIRSILDGSLLPDRIVLYLDTQKFPGEVLPPELEALKSECPLLEVRFDPAEIRSYKKLVPALRDFPEDVIVTIDDDIQYHRDMLRDLVRLHRQLPDAIIAHRVRKVKLDAPYRAWRKYKWYDFLFKRIHRSHLAMLTGVGGVLYPPHALDEAMLDPKLFMAMAPTNDDVWFWAAAVSKGTYVVPLPNGQRTAKGVGKPAEYALMTANLNSENDKNRQALDNIMERFPTIRQRFMHATAPSISLIVTTYNNPPFLEMVLKSILRQRVYPKEVVIADDGSGEETKRLIERYQQAFPVPLIHSWIPDCGFRLSMSRNKALIKATGDYIVMIDGDMVLTPHFIGDHQKLKQKGFFVVGSRAPLSEKATRLRLQTLNPAFYCWSPGIKRRLVLVRMPFLSSWLKGKSGISRARGCHLAFWKEDCMKVNGFEENFESWGYEDSDYFQRLLNIGIKRKNAKGMAGAVHLYHPKESRVNAGKNWQMLQETITSHRTRAQKGIDQYTTL